MIVDTMTIKEVGEIYLKCNKSNYNMCDFSKYMSNVVIIPCNKERRELLKMEVIRMLMPTPIIEESELDIFKENPNPCPF